MILVRLYRSYPAAVHLRDEVDLTQRERRLGASCLELHLLDVNAVPDSQIRNLASGPLGPGVDRQPAPLDDHKPGGPEGLSAG